MAGQHRVIKPAEERRRELIDAARELFMELGYEAATMSSIAKRAGVAQGTAYIYFESKQDILMAIMRELLETMAEVIRQVAERTDLPAPALLQQAMTDCFTRVGEEARLVEAIILQANYSLPSQLQEQFAPTVLPIITAIIERGVQEGSLHVTHPRLAAEFLWTTGYRLFELQAQQRFGREPQATVSELQAAFWEFVSQGLGAGSGGGQK